MDTVKKTKEIEDESEEWVYNYYGRERVEQFREEGREEGRKEGRKEGREEGRKEEREAERRRIIMRMLKMRYSIKSIKTILQLPEDEILKIAKENNVVVL